MLIVGLIVLQVIIFATLIIALKKILTQNVVSATSHLDHMASEYAKKEEEIKKQFEEAKRQSHEIVANAQKDAEQQKEKMIKQAEEERGKIINEAQDKADEIVHQADRARQGLLEEVETRISDAAKEKAGIILQESLPENIRKELHKHWMKNLINGDFGKMERLHVPQGTTEAKLISAFSLSNEEKDALSQKISEKLGFKISVKDEVDPGMIAGLQVIVGELILDGTLRFKIQEATRVE